MVFADLLQASWFILPAYFANASPVIAYKLLGKYNLPIDFGRKIFGPGKTWGGLLFGILIGTLVGFLQGNLQLGILLSLGAHTGDLVGSLIKRRLGFERGNAFPGMDQLGFLAFAILFAYPIAKPSLVQILILLILTPAIHVGANVVAFLLKLKKEWY